MPGQKLTTPPRRIDPALDFPELLTLAKTTVRLHPRQGTPTADESSMGGPLLWPANQPWPTCSGRHGRVRKGRQSLNAVPILQLFRRDVPELPFPEGKDLFQLLWCPTGHGWLNAPRTFVRWRDSRRLRAGIGHAPPPGQGAEERFLPKPCVLSPERVLEYPPTADLPWDMDDWEHQVGRSYREHVSTAPGTKVGGWVEWIQDPRWLHCSQGHRMEHLLTVSSIECWEGIWEYWLPEEERALVQLTARVTPDGGICEGAHLPRLGAGLSLLDAGSMYLFICQECPDHPLGMTMQTM